MGTENLSKVICDASCRVPQEKDVLASQLCWLCKGTVNFLCWAVFDGNIDHSNVALVPSALQSQEFSPAQGVWGL